MENNQVSRSISRPWNSLVKGARAHHFSNLIAVHQHNPSFLLKTLALLVNPASPCASANCDADCENILIHFVSKVELLRVSISPNPAFLDVVHPTQDPWSYFSSITMAELMETMLKMKPSSSPLDLITAKFLIEVLEYISPHLLLILNSSSSTGCVPVYFKTACVQPVLKKT